jgi:outer membrane receptor for ferrienterochelin and colicins
VRTEVVSREEAARRGATNVAEALAGEAALNVNPEAYGYLGRPSGVQIQGLDGDRVLVLEDGEPVLGDVGGVVDLAQLSLMDVERVEYVAGPMSSLYGTNALGGVVNVLSAPPRAPGLRLRFREEARSRGELFAEASAAHRDGDSWQALDASFRDRHGVEFGYKPGLRLPYERSYAVGLRGGLAPAENVALLVKLRFSHQESEGLASQRKPVLYLLDSRDQIDRFTIRARPVVELSQTARLEVSLAKSWYVTRSDEFFRDSPVGQRRRRHLEDESLEGIVTLTDTPARTWVFGIRNELEHFEQFTQATAVDGGSLETAARQEVEPALMYTGAPFGQLEWRLFDRWTLLPGVRGEVHNTYGAVLAPRLSTAAELMDELTLRAAVGRGFRAPSARERGFEFDHSSAGYVILGNPELEPETSWGVSGDATLRAEPFRMRAGWYVNWVRDLIDIADPRLAGGDQVGGGAPRPANADADVYRYRNIARARTAGADVSLRAELDDWLATETGYAYVWTRDDTAGQPLPNRPSHSLTIGADLELPFGLNSHVHYKVVSGAHGFIDDQPNEESFGLLDGRVGLWLFAGLEAYAGVLNLFDVKRDPENAADVRPALGRSLYIGLRGEAPGEEQ